ncbi:uncharacterized protein CIMG_12704 [Coccidioides immitis RS]|uniref:Uncharacterized protein n=1 Tax=Coccidioides immitis (strain RS) TaxID=246410 RepID=A0A0D8JUT9_COCIM|nr:uncharacterized protein CIMG_12704 [Coccidioides immitis RS]KJF60043.1 hypothetical protein CIMG_12704 [Coccidioides immitis RS]
MLIKLSLQSGRHGLDLYLSRALCLILGRIFRTDASLAGQQLNAWKWDALRQWNGLVIVLRVANGEPWSDKAIRDTIDNENPGKVDDWECFALVSAPDWPQSKVCFRASTVVTRLSDLQRPVVNYSVDVMMK